MQSKHKKYRSIENNYQNKSRHIKVPVVEETPEQTNVDLHAHAR